MKRCPKCEFWKPPSDFNRAANRRDGLQVYCRDCQRGVDKAFYDANDHRKEKIRGTRTAAKEAAQDYVLAYLMSHPCIDCGEDDIVVLDFDHLDGKSHNVSDMVRRGFKLATIQAEIDKCEVRCANDHRRMTAKRHGGWWRVLGVEPDGTAAVSKTAIDSVRFRIPLPCRSGQASQECL